MTFTCEFATLLKKLKEVSIVSEDASSNAELKGIAFQLSKKGVNLVGVNALVNYRTHLDPECYRLALDSDEDIIFQIRGKELLNFLGAYTNTRRTVADEVTFSFNSHKQILCMVTEKDKETEQLYKSNYLFDNLQIKRPSELAIRLVSPTEGLETIKTESLLLCTKTMLPIMTQGINLYANLLFDEANMVAFSSAYTTIMKNPLKEANGVFAGVTIPYKVLVFLDKIMCQGESIQVTKTDNHIYFKNGEKEAFVLYGKKLTNYQPAVDMYKKDHALVLDRVYLKDTLKRLKLNKESIEFIIHCKERVVTVKNPKYSQSISILQTKDLDAFADIKFKIMPEVLDKAIIGNDADFGEETYIYYCPFEGKAKGAIVFADNTGSWYSVVRVATY